MFSQIIGREETVQNLRRAIRVGKVAHAYLVEGERGSGKMMLARAFAQALQCEKHDGDGCGECPSCKRALGNNHPDIIYVTHEKPGLISIDEIRTQLVSDAQIRPYYGNHKVYIVRDAQKMNEAAQNALLKTLEEPPAYVVILLLTDNPLALLETVRSRCELLYLKPIRDDLVEKYLMEQLKIPDYQAGLCRAFAQGSLGRAIELARSEDFAKLKETALQVTAHTGDMDLGRISQLAKEMAPFKATVSDFFDLLTVWYRDVLCVKATGSANELIFRDEQGALRAAARTHAYEGIEQILRAIERARRRVDANVNYELAMEELFMTMKENSN